MTDQPAPKLCAAITQSGHPCKKFAIPGSEYCSIHYKIYTANDDGHTAEEIPAVMEEASPAEEIQDQPGLFERLKSTISEDLLDLDTWKGMLYMLNNTLEYQSDILKRRVNGEYETDEWGLDREYLDTIRPFFDFLYTRYWRVETSGIENIPEAGRALLVSNHSGQLPWDGAMVALAVMREHPSQRLVRTLFASWFPTLPFFGEMFTRCGQVLATEENGVRLLEQDELVAVYPEGYKGVGKLYKERYRLARFGRGGFVRMALKTGAPMIPVSVVGAEETYISLAKSPAIARLIHFPYFPISPTFPWTGLLGFIPLPTKWYIDFGEPIQADEYGEEAANNLALISQLTDRVRNIIQDMIKTRLYQRRSVFRA
ncbi:MAG: lysophospholipid acyltransferase family protein [Omnitrophica WOR_2 bacterium]